MKQEYKYKFLELYVTSSGVIKSIGFYYPIDLPKIQLISIINRFKKNNEISNL